jgi:hypothetical protein
VIVFIAICMVGLCAFAWLLWHIDTPTHAEAMERFSAQILEVQIKIGEELTPVLRRAAEQMRVFDEALRREP